MRELLEPQGPPTPLEPADSGCTLHSSAMFTAMRGVSSWSNSLVFGFYLLKRPDMKRRVEEWKRAGAITNRWIYYADCANAWLRMSDHREGARRRELTPWEHGSLNRASELLARLASTTPPSYRLVLLVEALEALALDFDNECSL